MVEEMSKETKKFQQLLLCLEAYADQHDMQVLYVDNFEDLSDYELEFPPYSNNIVVDSFGVICIPDDAP